MIIAPVELLGGETVPVVVTIGVGIVLVVAGHIRKRRPVINVLMARLFEGSDEFIDGYFRRSNEAAKRALL